MARRSQRVPAIARRARGVGVAGAALLACVAAGAGPAPLRAGPAPGTESGPGSAVRVRDLGREVADIARAFPAAADSVQEYYRSAAASVHLHVLGLEQLTPLHIHRRTEELTVIVAGSPRVAFEFGRDGAPSRVERSLDPGAMVVSLPFAGHEWLNPDAGAVQANLVFAMPPFEGNLYLRPADARTRGGPEPLVLEPEALLREAAASGKPFLLTKLPLGGDVAVSLVVRETASIPAHPRSPTFLYVTRGRGRLLLDGGYPLQELALLEVPPGAPLRIVAEPRAPLVVVAFRPED